MNELVDKTKGEGPRWGVERARTVVQACCIFEAEYECDNCGHTCRLLTELHQDEFAWLCEGTLEHEDDCPDCGDTMKLLFPQNPILTLKNRKIAEPKPRASSTNSSKAGRMKIL